MNTETDSAGHALFAQYAYPPNELGYCGPTDGWRATTRNSPLTPRSSTAPGRIWPPSPRPSATSDPLDEDVVRSYWVGGPSLDKVDPAELLQPAADSVQGPGHRAARRRCPAATGVLAHHSFHVFVVYPWVRFLDRDPATALRVMQDCRIRWGTVESVAGEQVVIASRPLSVRRRQCSTLGEPETERVQWSKGGLSLAPAPVPGTTVSAHWDWVCGDSHRRRERRAGKRDADHARSGQHRPLAIE